MEIRKKIKILITTTKSDLGGSSRYIIELMYKLPENVIPYFVMDKQGYLSEELEKMGHKDNIYFIPMTNSIANIGQHIKTSLKTLKLINKIKPDLIHCNCTTAGIAGRICGFLARVPVCYTAHGWNFTEGKSKKIRVFYKVLETFLAFLTSKIICVSEYDRQIALKLFPYFENKLVTILNGISDLEEYKHKRFENEPLNIVMMSRFCPQKDPYTLIMAINKLYKEGIIIKLNIYGYGEEKDKVLNQIKKCANPNIQFCGIAQDIPRILDKNDIYALISNWEGLPIGIIEGMRQGMPIIASDVGGNSEAVINGKNGYLVQRKNVDELVEVLRKILNSKEKLYYLGQKSRELYEQYFTAKVMQKKTLEVYKGVLFPNE